MRLNNVHVLIIHARDEENALRKAIRLFADVTLGGKDHDAKGK